MPDRDIIQRLLALVNQWRRCSNGLKGFQGHQTLGADTHVFLRMYGINTDRKCWIKVFMQLVTVHNCYKQFYHPSCEQVQYLQNPATAETVIPNGSTVEIVISDTSRSLPVIVISGN